MFALWYGAEGRISWEEIERMHLAEFTFLCHRLTETLEARRAARKPPGLGESIAMVAGRN